MPEPLLESSAPALYDSVPVQIRAVRWDGSAPHAHYLISWVLEHGGRVHYRCNDDDKPCPDTDEGHHLLVETLEGNMRLDSGWWLIQGTEGEFYPCKDSVFRRKYQTAGAQRG